MLMVVLFMNTATAIKFTLASYCNARSVGKSTHVAFSLIHQMPVAAAVGKTDTSYVITYTSDLNSHLQNELIWRGKG